MEKVNDLRNPRTLFNAPDRYVDEALEGMVSCFGRDYAFDVEDRRVIMAPQTRRAKTRRVGVISLGGFGHLPVFSGYVGRGLLDACAVGNVFASPSAAQIANAVRAADRGQGVVAIVGNYGGDVMNTKLATSLLAAEGIKLESVIVRDDVASAAFDERQRRRGVAGLVLAIKIAGAAADEGLDLATVLDLAGDAMDNCRSYGVALVPCVVPHSGRPTFEINASEMEFGMGIHGEPGVSRRGRLPADETVDFMIDRLIEDFQDAGGAEIALLINSLGATPIEELFIMGRRATERLEAEELTLRWCKVGRYATSMEMSGASLTMMKVTDDVVKLLDAPASCPFWRV